MNKGNRIPNASYLFSDPRLEKNNLMTETNKNNEIFVFGNSINILHPKNIGNLYANCYDKYGEPLIVIGTNKLSLVIIYQILLHLSYLFLLFYVFKGLFNVLKIINSIVYFLLFFNHFSLFLLNPGLVKRNRCSQEFKKTDVYKNLSRIEKKNYQYCEICNVIVRKDEKVEHCEECNICIQNYQNHCGWIGKCIGRNNYCDFYLNLFGTFIYVISFTVSVVVWLFIYNKFNDGK
jgi:hypothetical protein